MRIEVLDRLHPAGPSGNCSQNYWPTVGTKKSEIYGDALTYLDKWCIM